MKTKPIYLYWCKTDIPGVGLCHECYTSKPFANAARRRDVAAGFPCGPIVRVEVPLPARDEGGKK